MGVDIEARERLGDRPPPRPLSIKTSHGSAKARWTRSRPRPPSFRAGYCHPAEAFIDDMVYDPKDPGSLPGPGCAWINMSACGTRSGLGRPTNLPFANLLDAQYAFHDASLSRFVRSGRHAVAIDEKRHTSAGPVGQHHSQKPTPEPMA